MKRKILIALGLIMASIIGYITFILKGSKSNLNAYSFIPETAIFVIDSEDPIEGWKELSKSETWQHIKGFESLKDIESIADDLDKVIKENKNIFKLIGKRKLLLSAHMTKKDDYSFLYVLDAQTTQKSVLRSSLVKLLQSGNTVYKRAPYKQIDIHDFYSKEDKSTLHLVLMENHLLVSYSKAIITASIDNYKGTPAFTTSDAFTDLENETSNNGLCRIFVNYKHIPEYLLCFMQELSPETRGFISSLQYSGLRGDVDDNTYQIKGKTYLTKSNDSYAQALQKSGKSEFKVHKILSDKTAFLLRLGFDDFETFYENLTGLLKQNNTFKEFETNQKKIENYLGINLEEDFFSWIDDEVALVQYEKQYLVNDNLQNLIAIKATDIGLAKEKLHKIETQIRKKTPIKFKSGTYKDHEIHYMEVKGLFKLMFGKMFSKVDKPYYTFIDDYVLFSDDVKSLLFTIESYENETTLEENSEFNDFMDAFESDNSVMAYLSAPHYFENFSKLLDYDSWKAAQENKSYITCFKHIGLVFTAEDKGFETEISTFYELPEIVTEEEAVESEDIISDMEMFVITHLNKDVRKLYYETGELHIMVPIQSGKYHGAYYEYHKNGEVKVKGRYKRGNKTRRFRFYDEKGKKVKVEKY